MTNAIDFPKTSVTIENGFALLPLTFSQPVSSGQATYVQLTVPKALWHGTPPDKALSGAHAMGPVAGAEIVGAPKDWGLVARKAASDADKQFSIFFSNMFAWRGGKLVPYQHGAYPTIAKDTTVTLKLPVAAIGAIDAQASLAGHKSDPTKIAIQAGAAKGGGGGSSAPAAHHAAHAPHVLFEAKSLSGDPMSNTAVLPSGTKLLVAWHVKNATAEETTLNGQLPGNSTTMSFKDGFGNTAAKGAVQVEIFGSQIYNIKAMVKNSAGAKIELRNTLAFGVASVANVAALKAEAPSCLAYHPVKFEWTATNATAATVRTNYPQGSGLSAKSLSAAPNEAGEVKGESAFMAPPTGTLNVQLQVTEKTGQSYTKEASATVANWSFNTAASGLPSGWPQSLVWVDNTLMAGFADRAEWFYLTYYAAEIGLTDASMNWQFKPMNLPNALAMTDASPKTGPTILLFNEDSKKFEVREAAPHETSAAPITLPKSDDLIDGLMQPVFVPIQVPPTLRQGYEFDGNLGINPTTGLIASSVVDQAQNSSLVCLDSWTGKGFDPIQFNTSITSIDANATCIGTNSTTGYVLERNNGPRMKEAHNNVGEGGLEILKAYPGPNGTTIYITQNYAEMRSDDNRRLADSTLYSPGRTVCTYNTFENYLYFVTASQAGSGIGYSAVFPNSQSPSPGINYQGIFAAPPANIIGLWPLPKFGLCALTEQNVLLVYDGEGKLQRQITRMSSGAKITAVSAQPTLPFIALGGEDGSVMVVGILSWQVISSYRPHKELVRAVALSACGTRLVSVDRSTLVQYRRMPFQIANAGQRLYIATPEGKLMSYDRSAGGLTLHNGDAALQLVRHGTSVYTLSPTTGHMTRFDDKGGMHACAPLPQSASHAMATLTSIGKRLYYVTSGGVRDQSMNVPQDLMYDPETNRWDHCGQGLVGLASLLACREEGGAPRAFALGGVPMVGGPPDRLCVATLSAAGTSPYFNA